MGFNGALPFLKVSPRIFTFVFTLGSLAVSGAFKGDGWNRGLLGRLLVMILVEDYKRL
jgi:hypothetical protein